MENQVFVQLTEDEIRERGKALAQLFAELLATEADKKDSNKKFNEDIKDLKATILDLSVAIRSGQELRDAQMDFSNVRSLKDAG
jgi:hypothetical protein